MGSGPSRVGNSHSSGANAGSKISNRDSPASTGNSVLGLTGRHSLAFIFITLAAARCGGTALMPRLAPPRRPARIAAIYSAVKGIRAIWRDRLMATVSWR